MAEVEISYKGSNIATMNASGTKTLLTEGKYLEDNVEVTYTRPAAPSGTKNINSNGTHDVTQYASANVQVPNTYAAGDEGKVVSNGALVAQTSRSIDTNGTYDTTTNNEVVVNVGGGGLPEKILNYIEFTPTTTLTDSNKGTFNLTPTSACVIVVSAYEYPSAPDPAEYIALSWDRTVTATVTSRILRPTGVVGTDGNMCSFNASTGVLSVGGQYGYFQAGRKYFIVQVARA